MLLSFKIDEGYLKRIEELQEMRFLSPFRFSVMNNNTRLVYEGTHRDFRQHVIGIKMLFENGFGSLYPIATYIADDSRLRWYEDLDTYLLTRAPWREFFYSWRSMACADEIGNLPERFVSQRRMFQMVADWLADCEAQRPYFGEVTDFLDQPENAGFNIMVVQMQANFKKTQIQKHKDMVQASMKNREQVKDR